MGNMKKSINHKFPSSKRRARKGGWAKRRKLLKKLIDSKNVTSDVHPAEVHSNINVQDILTQVIMLRRTRKRKSEDEDQVAVDGEQDNFFSDEIREEMETMWEIPQIFHFLHLTKESLNIPQLSMYEMERMLSIPRASKQLANIMTSLLSSPVTKAKLRKVPPMPYEFWTNILAHKIASWFKVYHAKHEDATKVLETIGVEPEFWNIFPDASLLDGKDFENLSFKQRVWLLKTVCDTIMHTRKTVQEDMAKQPWEDQFETILGIDRYGARYIYFPQFIANDLRIYRLCLDNKILSTVRPVRPKQEANLEANNPLHAKFNRYRMRKAQSSNNNNKNMSEQANRRESRLEDKDLSYKSNNDSATSSFISEDTNLSSTSTCSNNNISLDAVNRKRCRSLSKTSDESILSNAKSSGYDTNTSSDNRSLDDDDVKMFKGFSNVQGDSCKIGMINEILDDLKSEIDEDVKTNGCESDTRSSGLTSQEDFEGLCKKTMDSCVETTLTIKKEESERSIDTLSGTSKTDDEKLNDIISAESSKLPAGVCSKRVSASDNAGDNISTSSKSDDEKLSETKSSSGNISDNCKKNGINKSRTFNGSLRESFSNNASLSRKVAKRKSKEDISMSSKAKSNDSIRERSPGKRQLRSRHRAAQRDAKDKAEEVKKKEEGEVKKKEKKKQMESEDDADENSSAVRARLEETMNDDDSDDDYANSENGINGYNLRRSKTLKTDECKEHFNKLLSDLSVCDFQLVADSVEGLRDLIASFMETDLKNASIDIADIVPLCEIKLVKKLTELLTSLEGTETVLKDATRKAKSKLQREWSNFKEGAVHCQLPEMQRYKRYRSLPYPHLAPKTNSRDPKQASTRARAKTSSRAAVRVRRATMNDETAARKRKSSRSRGESKTGKRNRSENVNGNVNAKRTKSHLMTKIQNNRRDECYEHVASPRTQSNFTQTTRAIRTSWRNGPTLRQSMRLPAHRPIHPLLTLLRKSDTLTTGRIRRTQTKIGFYRALAKGKINVRLPIEG